MTDMAAVAVEADISGVAAAIGDPSRARVLMALAGGRALPSGVLAEEAGVSASTISEHLSKLLAAKLLTVERDGRHRFYRLATPEVARILEGLARLARPVPVHGLRRATRANALRRARLCYDHLAGQLGVALMAALLDRGVLAANLAALPAVPGANTPYEPGASAEYAVTTGGASMLRDFGVQPPPSASTVRYCVDWIEHRPHLAGAFGGALADRLFELGWLRRGRSPRLVHVTDAGTAGLLERFGIEDVRDVGVV